MFVQKEGDGDFLNYKRQQYEQTIKKMFLKVRQSHQKLKSLPWSLD
jgi:hypothetical protein